MTTLAELPAIGQHGHVRVIVECPRGATLKFRFEPALGSFGVARPLPRGLSYPYDWGFVPGTRAPDGDPLDALVLHDAATYPGVVLDCEPVALLALEESGDGGRRERNDRLVFRPAWAPDEGPPSERLRDELERFFLDAVFFTAKAPRVLGWEGAEAARAAVERARR